MTSTKHKTSLIGVCAIAIAVSIAIESMSASLERFPAQNQQAPDGPPSSRRMADGKQWTTQNLSVKTVPSYCYDDAESNCRLYGRLYTWESAQRACQSLGDGWRLPTDDEWRRLAKSYGGIFEDSADSGKAAYTSLLSGGGSGFNALLGGGRDPDGKYARLEAHGFYWTASERDGNNALYYNFGKGRPALYRQNEGEKPGAFAVRCVRE